MAAAELPEPPEGYTSPRELLALLARAVGEQRAAQLCVELLACDNPREHAETVLLLGGRPGRALLDGHGFDDFWARVWGARGLLYVWDDAAAPVVLQGLGDPAWRVAEMCLKVSAKRELPSADQAVRLAGHELPRVRAVAMRVLGVSGDTEHLEAAIAALDDPAGDVRRAAASALDRLASRLDLPPR